MNNKPIKTQHINKVLMKEIIQEYAVFSDMARDHNINDTEEVIMLYNKYKKHKK